MSEPESGARTRLVLMGLVLVLVIAGIFWLKRQGSEATIPGAKPGASEDEIVAAHEAQRMIS